MHFTTDSSLKKIIAICNIFQSNAPSDTESSDANIANQIPNNPPLKSKLSAAILGFCFASALSLLVLFFEIKTQLPLLVHLFALAITCAFATIFIAEFIGRTSNFCTALKRAGYVFAAIAFFLAISIPSPLWLSIISWFIFFLGLFLVFKYYAPVSVSEGGIQEEINRECNRKSTV